MKAIHEWGITFAVAWLFFMLGVGLMQHGLAQEPELSEGVIGSTDLPIPLSVYRHMGDDGKWYYDLHATLVCNPLPTVTP